MHYKNTKHYSLDICENAAIYFSQLIKHNLYLQLMLLLSFYNIFKSSFLQMKNHMWKF